MNKSFLILAILMIAGVVMAVQAGVTFTPQQVVNADIVNYDFELTNEGWSNNLETKSWDFTFGYITGEKVYDESGDWTGELLTVQKYRVEKYWKQRYANCREGISPYVYQRDTGEIDESGQPIYETITDTSKEGCVKQAKENIKSRVITFRENERAKLLKIQAEAQDYLNSYDSEWTNPSYTDTELNE